MKRKEAYKQRITNTERNKQTNKFTNKKDIKEIKKEGIKHFF